MRLTMILLSIIFLFGCVPPSQNQLKMEKDFAEMKRRLAQLEIEKAKDESSQSANGDSLQRQVAEVVAGQDNLRVEFQSVNGQLDDMRMNNQQLEDDLNFSKEDFGLQLAAINSRLDQLEQASNRLSEEIKKVPAPAPAPVVKPAPVKPQETAEELYQRALNMVRKEDNFAEGRKLLEQFISKYPQHDLYVNALYWSGESLYGEGKYELAILQFQDVISKHPGHSKSSASMLKQALAFNALGDGQNARTTMQKLIETYPNSEQVEAAKKFLGQ